MAVETIKACFTPFLPGMYDDFSVAASAKNVSQRGQLAHKRSKVENLTIEHDAYGPIFVEEGLSASGDIDDCQTSMSQPNLRTAIKALSIRTAMIKYSGHSLQ